MEESLKGNFSVIYENVIIEYIVLRLSRLKLKLTLYTNTIVLLSFTRNLNKIEALHCVSESHLPNHFVPGLAIHTTEWNILVAMLVRLQKMETHWPIAFLCWKVAESFFLCLYTSTIFSSDIHLKAWQASSSSENIPLYIKEEKK